MAEQNRDEILKMYDSWTQQPRHDEQAQSPGELQSRYPMLDVAPAPPPLRVVTPKRSYPRKNQQQQGSALADVQALKQQAAFNPQNLLERGMTRVPEGTFFAPNLNQFNIRSVLPDSADTGTWDPTQYTQEELDAIMDYLRGKYGEKHTDALDHLARGKMRGLEKQRASR